MTAIKLTKNELRLQQLKLAQLTKYLPTLQLKKAMLQEEVNKARAEVTQYEQKFTDRRKQVEGFSPLWREQNRVDPKEACKVEAIQRRYENIAGVEIPYFEGVSFHAVSYSLFESPPWLDGAIAGLRNMRRAQVEVLIAQEKKLALEKELRQVTIRVNLFEKIMIPRALENIKKIKVFLGDQQLAAVSQAKAAKGKIIRRKALAQAAKAKEEKAEPEKATQEKA